MMTKKQRAALRELAEDECRGAALLESFVEQAKPGLLALLDALDEMERERNRLHSRVFELEHFKGDAERRTKEDIARRLLGAVGRVAGMEIAPGADAVEWTVNKLAGLDEELRRLRLELAGQQAEGRALRAQQHLDDGHVRVPPSPLTFSAWDAEIERVNRGANAVGAQAADNDGSLLGVLPEYQVNLKERGAVVRAVVTSRR